MILNGKGSSNYWSTKGNSFFLFDLFVVYLACNDDIYMVKDHLTSGLQRETRFSCLTC